MASSESIPIPSLVPGVHRGPERLVRDRAPGLLIRKGHVARRQPAGIERTAQLNSSNPGGRKEMQVGGNRLARFKGRLTRLAAPRQRCRLQ